MKSWYVIHTHAQGESRALAHLERQGFDAWLPLCRKTRRHAGRRETVLRPLFPRYLFVSVDMEDEPWRAILSTRGVQALISDAGRPTTLADGVVEALRARAGEDGIFDLRPDALKAGTKVRIASGPFADLEGIFQTQSDSERVQVLLTLMGRAVRVTVSELDIERE
jgi:transcriptional antiterminator RfaH